MSTPTTPNSPPPSSPSDDVPRPVGGYSLSKPVFFTAGGIILLAVAFALLLPDVFNSAISTLNSTVVSSIGWYYVLIVTAFVGFGIVVAASRMGNIKLGKDDDEPEYSLFSWFAMLFAAGMGIGLVFWGAAEPLTFYSEAGAPPNAAGLADPDRGAGARGPTLRPGGRPPGGP